MSVYRERMKSVLVILCILATVLDMASSSKRTIADAEGRRVKSEEELYVSVLDGGKDLVNDLTLQQEVLRRARQSTRDALREIDQIIERIKMKAVADAVARRLAEIALQKALNITTSDGPMRQPENYDI
jgi:hypothetical protein